MTEVIPETAPLDLPLLVDKYKPDVLLLWDWTGNPACYVADNKERTFTLNEKVPFIYVQHEGWANALERKNLFNPTVCYTGMPYGVKQSPIDSKTLGYKYLAGACYPKVHKITKTWAEKSLDCVLFAGMYSPRPEICQALHDDGLNIVYGNVATKEYVEFHNSSRTTWEFSGGSQYIKWRIFEAMAMGCVVITDTFKLLGEVGFESWKHYVPHIPVDDMPMAISIARGIRMVRQWRDFSETVREEAWNYVMSNHTYEHRAKMILKDIGA